MPLAKIEGLKRASGVQHYLGATFNQQGKGPPSGAHVHGLPQAVQNQHMLIEVRTHSPANIRENYHA